MRSRFHAPPWLYGCVLSEPPSLDRHATALADRQKPEYEANGRWERPLIHAQPHERAGVTVKVVLVTALAMLTGLYVTRAIRR